MKIFMDTANVEEIANLSIGVLCMVLQPTRA